MAIMAMRKGSDHGIVADGVANGQWSSIKELVSEFDVAGGGVSGKKGGCGDDIWFGNFIEQVAGIGDVGGFAIMVDEAVEEEREWVEAGSEDVAMDGTCQVRVAQLGQVSISQCPNVHVAGTFISSYRENVYV